MAEPSFSLLFSFISLDKKDRDFSWQSTCLIECSFKCVPVAGVILLHLHSLHLLLDGLHDALAAAAALSRLLTKLKKKTEL